MPFSKPELANAVPWSQRWLVARWLRLFPGRKLAGRALAGAVPWSGYAVLQARASQSMIAR